MLVCTFAMHTMVMADNDKPIQVKPVTCKGTDIYQDLFQRIIKVAMAKMESGVFYKSYDVVFTNGEKWSLTKRENGKKCDADRAKCLPRSCRKLSVTM